MHLLACLARTGLFAGACVPALTQGIAIQLHITWQFTLNPAIQDDKAEKQVDTSS
jgi:hypothetical protein